MFRAQSEQALRAQPNNPAARKLLCAAYSGVGENAAALTERATLRQATDDDREQPRLTVASDVAPGGMHS